MSGTAVDDHLGEAFDDRGLADARLHRAAPGCSSVRRQRIWMTFDSFLAADDRVELLLLGQFGQVATKAVESRSLAAACALGCRAGTGCCSAAATFF
jgi:hypothetical protein